MIDSALIAWALGSPPWFLAHYAALPWNVPERRNFAGSLASRLLVYLMKCVPVTRGGDRGEVAGVLGRLVYLLHRGEAVLVFPEGGRSRSGRVDVENAAYGVGRMIGDLPRCRVLCVYLRGERQDGFSDLPARGERFHVRLAAVRPTSDQNGMRRARDLAQQVVRGAGDPRAAVHSAVARLPARATGSEAVRRLAIARLSRLLAVAPEELAIRREGRIPALWLRGCRSPADLSLSHHGRFVAFACRLP